jgi:periplasmic protein TonB
MTKNRNLKTLGKVWHYLCVMVMAAFLTVAVFIVLPVMQSIAKPLSTDMVVQNVDTANVPPPPPPPQEEPEPEPEEEPTPPELTEQAPPLALDQLELALNPGFGEGFLGGDFAINLNAAASEGKSIDELFSLADLDQKPRPVYQPGPRVSSNIRKKAPGKVYVIFVVDKEGKVENPIVQSSTDTVFERPAISAVKQWKFEPGKINGQSVRFRMRVPFTFPKG